MSKGLFTIAKDNFFDRYWTPLFGGWRQKTIHYDGTHDGLLSFINMATGVGGTLIDPDNPVAQIKANKRTVHAAVKMISNAVAITPLRVYKPKAPGVKSNYKITKVREVPAARQKELIAKATPGSVLANAEAIEEITGGHPLVDLLTNVNGAWDNFGLKFVTPAYMELSGDCYWVLIKNGHGLPAAIWIAPSEYMRIKPDENTGVGYYVYKRGSKEHIFEPEDVVHMRLYAPGADYQFYGRGDVAAAADPFNLQELIQQFEQKVFKNGAFLGGVLSTTGRTTEAQQKKLSEEFQTAHGAVAKAGGWMVMENVEPKPLMMTPRELDYQDARKVLMEEMLTNFSVPVATMTGQSTTRAALETSLTQLAIFSTAALCTLISEALNAQLAPLYPGNLIIAFDNPIMEDKQFQLKRDMIDLKMGIRTIDELRIRDGNEPFGGNAAEPMVDANRIPLSMVGGAMTQVAAERVATLALEKAMSKYPRQRM